MGCGSILEKDRVADVLGGVGVIDLGRDAPRKRRATLPWPPTGTHPRLQLRTAPLRLSLLMLRFLELEDACKDALGTTSTHLFSSFFSSGGSSSSSSTTRRTCDFGKGTAGAFSSSRGSGFMECRSVGDKDACPSLEPLWHVLFFSSSSTCADVDISFAVSTFLCTHRAVHESHTGEEGPRVNAPEDNCLGNTPDRDDAISFSPAESEDEEEDMRGGDGTRHVLRLERSEDLPRPPRRCR